jgi:fructokinase
MRLGVDLGGTKIEAVIIDGNGNECWRQRVLTPQGDYEATLTAIAQLVQEGKRVKGISFSAAIGMGTPGAETSDGRMKNCNSTALNGRFLRRDISRLLDCPVKIANDANCFALAETHSGRGREVGVCMSEGGLSRKPPDVVFGVILGTGVGGGIVVNGSLLAGPNSIAGEWGHNPMSLQGDVLSISGVEPRACFCGRVNCVETFLSGPGLALSYQQRFGEALTPEKIIEHMRNVGSKRKESAELIWQQYMQQLATALASVVNILDPSLIVLGGGLSAVSEIYQDIVPLMRPHVFTDEFNTSILPALLGDSAGVYGAAWLVDEVT